MKKWIWLILLMTLSLRGHCWGFFGHRKINEMAVWLLPPGMLTLFKQHSDFLIEHAVDPDKRRYAVAEEAPRHYIDIDQYGVYPYPGLPRPWLAAVTKFTEDSLQKHGIVPWWLQTMMGRLTKAFKDKDQVHILKYAADLGHYMADAHVPLHATHNHNGQYSNQKGIHGFWESRIPELLADKDWDFFIGKAVYIKNFSSFCWTRVLESAAAVDTVLRCEKELSKRFPPDQKYAFEKRGEQTIRQYSSAFSIAYDALLKGMIERRMRQAILAVASAWYTAWVNAGQPDLTQLTNREFSQSDLDEFAQLNQSWKGGNTDTDH
jgi:hypothetical protein